MGCAGTVGSVFGVLVSLGLPVAAHLRPRPLPSIEKGRPTHPFAATGDGPGGFDGLTETWNLVLPLG